MTHDDSSSSKSIMTSGFGNSTTSTGRLPFPMLTRTNYAAWAMKLKFLLRANGAWGVVDHGKKLKGEAVDEVQDQLALSIISQSVGYDTLLRVSEKETAYDVWEALRSMHVGVKRVREARVQSVRADLDSLWMSDTESMDDFAGKFMTLVGRIREHGDALEEMYVVKKLQRSVSTKFINVASSLVLFRDINNMAMEEAIGSLKAHERMLRGQEFRAKVEEDDDARRFVIKQIHCDQWFWQLDNIDGEATVPDADEDELRGVGDEVEVPTASQRSMGVVDRGKKPKGEAVDEVQDQLALSIMSQSVDDDTLLRVSEKETAYDVWEVVRSMDVGVERLREARVQSLRADLDSLKMSDTESMDDFAGKFMTLVGRIRELGDAVEEKYVVKKLLRSVSTKFINVASSLVLFGDINNMAMEEAIGSLKAHEEMLKGQEFRSEEKLLIARGDSARGRGRAQGSPDGPKDKSKVKCSNCQDYGHFA
nr:unnamed protein product [Digitaria exilis]